MDYIAALTAFVEAAELGSFTRAAERLGIKASTISRYVSDLEADLGIALFNRSTRALKLTEGGLTLRVHASKVLGELALARSATSSLNDEPRGLLKLNVPPAFARHHVIPALAEFRSRFPDIDVELDCDEQHVKLIEAGADLAIRIGCLKNSTLKARKIAEEQWVLCAGPSVVSRFAGLMHPEELVGTDFIAAKSVIEPMWRMGDEQLCKRRNVQLKISDLEAQMIAVERGLGVALLPAWLVGRAIKEGRVSRLLEGWECLPGEGAESLWFVYPPKRIVSSKVRSFIDFMVGRIGAPPYWRL